MSTSSSPKNTVIRGIMKAFTPFHRWLLHASRGRIGQGWSSTRQPLILLTTTGRRSGEPRTAVVGYIEEGDTLVVVASKGGLPEHPAWYLNILANPEVSVERDGATQPMRARIAQGEERDRLWTKICTMYPPFSTYQAAITREIPVLLLDPVT